MNVTSFALSTSVRIWFVVGLAVTASRFLSFIFDQSIDVFAPFVSLSRVSPWLTLCEASKLTFSKFLTSAAFALRLLMFRVLPEALLLPPQIVPTLVPAATAFVAVPRVTVLPVAFPACAKPP